MVTSDIIVIGGETYKVTYTFNPFRKKGDTMNFSDVVKGGPYIGEPSLLSLDQLKEQIVHLSSQDQDTLYRFMNITLGCRM